MALDLNKFSGKDKSEIFHSSGYAQLGQGNTIGSAGGSTFQQRQAVGNMQDRTINGYHRSAMGMQRGQMRAKRFTPPTDGQAAKSSHISRQAFNAGDTGGGASGSRAPSSRQEFNAEGGSSGSSTTFREPPSRGYNPYA